MNRLHPLGKLLLSVLYIFTVVSFDKYIVTPLILMSVYLIFGFIMGDLSFREGIYRVRLILPLVIFVGILNPFFDKNVLFYAGSFTVTGGMVSMFTLMLIMRSSTSSLPVTASITGESSEPSTDGVRQGISSCMTTERDMPSMKDSSLPKVTKSSSGRIPIGESIVAVLGQ